MHRDPSDRNLSDARLCCVSAHVWRPPPARLWEARESLWEQAQMASGPFLCPPWTQLHLGAPGEARGVGSRACAVTGFTFQGGWCSRASWSVGIPGVSPQGPGGQH